MADKNILMQEFNRNGYDNLYPQIIPSFSQNVDLNSNRIVNVASPVNDNDGVNKKYVDMLQAFSLKKVGTITRMGQVIPFNANDALNCYGLILDYTLGIYSGNMGISVKAGITDSFGNFDSNYNSYLVGKNQNAYQFSAKVFFIKTMIETLNTNTFEFNISFGQSLGASQVKNFRHYFCCQGTSDSPAANAPINMDIYFLM